MVLDLADHGVRREELAPEALQALELDGRAGVYDDLAACY